MYEPPQVNDPRTNTEEPNSPMAHQMMPQRGWEQCQSSYETPKAWQKEAQENHQQQEQRQSPNQFQHGPGQIPKDPNERPKNGQSPWSSLKPKSKSRAVIQKNSQNRNKKQSKSNPSVWNERNGQYEFQSVGKCLRTVNYRLMAQVATAN